jgi:RNA polymerase sporulation-specific sigma factor
MLNFEETKYYIRLAKEGDEKAKEILLVNNENLIKSLVKRFLGKGVEYEDLFQLGCLGFVKAIKNFDESYQVMFSTYAVPMIVGEIKRFMRDDGAIKVSRAIKALAIRINNYI